MKLKKRLFKNCRFDVALVLILLLLWVGNLYASDSPDDYEDDDTVDTASVYYLFTTKNQSRNFHDNGDEDWIQFTTDVTYDEIEIKTFDPGPNCSTIISLFDTDKTTLIKEKLFTASGGKNSMTFFPQQSGTYYVRVKNTDPGLYGSGTDYTLAIFFPTGPLVGSMEGVVKDSATGLPIEGVKIEVEKYATSLSFSDGSYFFQSPTGSLTLTASKTGYETFQADIDVDEAFPKTLDIAMTPATCSTSFSISDNGIILPCILASGNSYQAVLTFSEISPDQSTVYFKLKDGSVGTGQTCSSGCAELSQDLKITVPEIEISGSVYQIGDLSPYTNPNDSANHYWALDLSSVKLL